MVWQKKASERTCINWKHNVAICWPGEDSRGSQSGGRDEELSFWNTTGKFESLLGGQLENLSSQVDMQSVEVGLEI